ncbi:hypothetical protein GCM10022211_10670 [Sphingomonas humi]|uniref:Ice-binding protein C-terminal domain-containing protein n=1 Tax=Sphingomonas humi TaxID=335630 RepID=A0ABP7RSE3_9SPHN
MLKKFAFAVAAAGALMAATPAVAADITVGQWYTFGFRGTGSAMGNGTGFLLGNNPSSIAAPDGPWTFTLGSSGSLTVVDGYDSGDAFTLSDFGSTLGTTSAPALNSTCGGNITACLANASISKGTFALGSGSHSITGTVQSSPFGGGAGFFIVQSAAVPEPGTWAMMIVGFGAIGFASRRRKRNAAPVHA